MRDSSTRAYYDTLHATGARANDAITEVYEDLQENLSSIAGVSSDRRSTLAKRIDALYDVCNMSSVTCRRRDDCIGILELSSRYVPSPDREVENALQMLERDFSFTTYEAVSLLEEAVTWGFDRATWRDERKINFLLKLMQGNGTDFLKTVLDAYNIRSGKVDARGKCGYEIGSSEYLRHLEKQVFLQELPSRSGEDYARILRESLEDIAKQLERDLSTAAQENSYITDPTAIVLRSAASELDRCNISPRISDDSIDRLAWFVGGDAEKIRQLQRKLNELNITDRLTEDGVYGKKTATAWIRFINVLSHGTLPTLLYVDPLKSSFDPLRENSEYTFSIRSSREGKNNAITNAKTGHHYFRIDPPHFDKNGNPQKGYYRGQKVDLDYNHLNVNFGNSPSRIEAWFNYRYNHQPLTSRQYDALKDLSKFGKTIRIEGRTLLIDGAFFDAFELGLALYEDLNDADRKLGQTFLSTSCGIVGGSLGGAAGAKIGAALGTLTGPLAPIAAPIFAIAGGVIGSYTGDSLFRYLVDISYLEE